MAERTDGGAARMLAHLEDCIFESLPVSAARAWPERLMSSIEPGADLSRIGWQFLHWLITDEAINPGISHPTVRDAVRRCADVIAPLTKGEAVDPSAAESAAASATWSAAESAARSAESAAWSAAWCAARSAESAACAAWSAAWSARSARSAAYVKMADKLIELISAAPRKDGGA